MKGSSLKVFRDRLPSSKEVFHVFDPLLKKEISVIVFDKEMNRALPDE
jgi:hypothetical protein